MLSCHDTILVDIDDDVAGNRKTKWWRRNSTICGDNYVSRHLHSALYKKTGDTGSGPEITWIIIWKNVGPNTMVVYGGTSPVVFIGYLTIFRSPHQFWVKALHLQNLAQYLWPKKKKPGPGKNFGPMRPST